MEYYTFWEIFFTHTALAICLILANVFGVTFNVSLNQEQTDTEHTKSLNLQVEQLQENEKKMLR